MTKQNADNTRPAYPNRHTRPARRSRFRGILLCPARWTSAPTSALYIHISQT